MPEPRWFHTAGLGADGRVLVYGGYVQVGRQGEQYGINGYSLVVYDPAFDVWWRGPAVPDYSTRSKRWMTWSGKDADGRVYGNEKRWVEHSGATKLGNEVLSGQADPFGRPHWQVDVGWVFFDTTQHRWTQLPAPIHVRRKDWRPGSDEPGYDWEGSVPIYRRRVGTTATDPSGKIYVIGGSGERFEETNIDRKFQLLDAVELYDATTNTWELKPPMRHARQLHAAAVGRDGRLYVFGGVASKGGTSQRKGESWEDFERRAETSREAAQTSLASVEIYDPATDRWSEGRPMPTPVQSMGAALGADDKIYVVGGARSYSEPTPTDLVQVYDPKTNRWEEGPSLRYRRRGHAVVATSDGKIYAIGGGVARKHVYPWDDEPGFMENGRDLRATVEVLDTKAGD